ncbi:MAG: DnaJ C-terminal domain-containing protein [Minisyncoccia bacterium]
MSKDYYKILGVDKKATKDDIKKAFRKLAHEYHPDKKGGSAEKFKEASEAYSVLSDDNKRAQYDMMGSGNFQGGFNGAQGFDFSQFAQQFGSQFSQGGMEFDMGDLFGDLFGGGFRNKRTSRGADIQVEIRVPFVDSVFGTERKIRINHMAVCDKCEGTASEPGSKMKECETCKGKGLVKEIRRTILGQIATERMCTVCAGAGEVPEKPCTQCRGKGVINKDEIVDIKIPAGINDGEVLMLSKMGEAIRGGTAGDLYVGVRVDTHSRFVKNGANLSGDLNVKLSDALLGAEINIETLDGPAKVVIPEGVKFGDIIRIKERGVPQQRGKRGDILLRVKIELPKKLSKEAKKHIEELKKEGL